MMRGNINGAIKASAIVARVYHSRITNTDCYDV